MRRAAVGLQVAVLALAAGTAFVPLPAAVVERYYADGWYPALQARLTSWSNESAIALFDVLVVVLGVAVVAAWVAWFGSAIRRRSLRPLLRGAFTTAVSGAVLYLWFLAAWGLNYSRPALESTIPYEPARVTASALARLAERATDEVNRAHAPGHAAGFGGPHEMPPDLVRALRDVERELGRPRATTPGRPKRTLFGVFFRLAGVDGMHAPFLLETLLNPDLTGPERPAVLAHEWAHLAGYAPEDDASFVGLLAALRADPGSRYSAWLALFHETVAQLPRGEQGRLLARLEPGPRADREAIAARVASRHEAVARASWKTYDQYLKSQGVEEGIRSYSRVVQLLLGTGALGDDRAR